MNNDPDKIVTTDNNDTQEAPDNLDIIPDADAAESMDARQEDDTTTAPDEQDEEEEQEDPSLDHLKEAIREQAREDEQPLSASFNLRKILGGDWLTANLLRRQLGVLVLIFVFVIIYISNRYSCQKDMLEIDRLNSELIDAKYRALSSSSELTEKCRESNVLKMLQNNKDSVLRIPSQPPYIIQVP
ncbi:MAG: hypothetical protein J6M94_00270 [Prevotella sp.]|nr:hypothetical protein [Prevotella sp.]